MSPFEIGYRTKEWIRNRFEKRFFTDIGAKNFTTESDFNWYLDTQNREAISDFVKGENLWNEVKARELLEHKFSFFSFNKTFLGENIDWHRDYKNDKKAPLRYCRDIDYRDFSEVGDFKYIWEINRHQHLISLAKAYYITGNQEYKNEIRNQILDWIEANPYKKGINWASSLELATRLISWSWAWVFLGDIDEGCRKTWIESIYKHCVFISHNFSKYSSANNHLIGEAAGLFIASILWPFGKESEGWQKKSFRILVDEMEKQNYADGVNKEQAISYQRFVLDFFILAGLLGEKNGIAFPETYWKRIEKMLIFVASVMDKNGNVPNIGDSDDGYAVILSEGEGDSYRSLLATGAILFERGDFADKAGRFDEKSFWLSGIEGWEKYNALVKRSFIPVKTFDQGGYYILSSHEDTEDEIKFIFDCGPLGYLSIAAHGHSDALSFVLNIGGKEFFIDPGTYVYSTQKEWRDYFRGTSAHNTLRIDAGDQSISGGNFMWIKKAQARLIKHEVTDEYESIIGEHNGYTRLKDPVLHQREILFDKKNRIFKIWDRYRAKKGHLIEQYFHFSKDCVIKNTGSNAWEIKNDKYRVKLSIDNKFDSNLICGSEDPMLGWESKRFDIKEKASTLVNSCKKSANGEFLTVISVV
jgi:hypothetical protein